MLSGWGGAVLSAVSSQQEPRDEDVIFSVAPDTEVKELLQLKSSEHEALSAILGHEHWKHSYVL